MKTIKFLIFLLRKFHSWWYYFIYYLIYNKKLFIELYETIKSPKELSKILNIKIYIIYSYIYKHRKNKLLLNNFYD